MKKTVLRKYADMIVRKGINVQKGQEVIIAAGLADDLHIFERIIALDDGKIAGFECQLVIAHCIASHAVGHFYKICVIHFLFPYFMLKRLNQMLLFAAVFPVSGEYSSVML